MSALRGIGTLVSARRIVWALLLVALAGCVDERAKVARRVFSCDATSPTADADCGAGFMCYDGTQSLGGSFCVPRCQAGVTCDGICTAAGACLERCTVPVAGKPDPCPSPLSCRRTTDSPLAAADGPDGVCLPLKALCSQPTDCTSPTLNECTSQVDGAFGNGLLTSGEFCVQGQCNANGISCAPGSACIKDLLPSTIPAPDICSPLCSSPRDVPVGFDECLPGMTCLSDAFPQINAPACAPGFAGWLCIDDLGCAAGSCSDWSHVDPALDGLKTCAAKCRTDNDCLPFDRGANPNAVSHNTCQDGVCRNLQSLFFPLTCLREGDTCQLDVDQSKCELLNPVASGVANSDMGMAADGCAQIDPTVAGLGAFGGVALTCTRECTSTADCRSGSPSLQDKLHVPLSCAATPAVGGSRCLPVVPFHTQCTSDADCFADLTCMPDTTSVSGKSVCTKACMNNDDCAASPVLGSVFACSQGQCIPKTPSGCAAANASLCLSGSASGGKCVSTLGWLCTESAQCGPGMSCVIEKGTSPPVGRCE